MPIPSELLRQIRREIALHAGNTIVVDGIPDDAKVLAAQPRVRMNLANPALAPMAWSSSTGSLYVRRFDGTWVVPNVSGTVPGPPNPNVFETEGVDAFVGVSTDAVPGIVQGTVYRLNGVNDARSQTSAPQQGALDDIKNKGYDAVRKVQYWNDWQPTATASHSPGQVEPLAQSMIDAMTTMIQRCEIADLYIILDPLHCGYYSNDPADYPGGLADGHFPGDGTHQTFPLWVSGTNLNATSLTGIVSVAGWLAMTKNGHGRSKCDTLTMPASGSPGGFTNGARYWLTNVGTNTFELASSLANAIAGVSIAATTAVTYTGTMRVPVPRAVANGHVANGGDTLDWLDRDGVQWWQQLAALYKDQKRVIAYDLINEPKFTDGINYTGSSYAYRARFFTVMAKLIAGIRAVDPYKIIMIPYAAGGWNTFDTALITQADVDVIKAANGGSWKNIVLTYHDYWAGAPASGSDTTTPWSGSGFTTVGNYTYSAGSGYPDYGNNADRTKKQIDNLHDTLMTQAANIATLAGETGVPIHIGEVGFNNQFESTSPTQNGKTGVQQRDQIWADRRVTCNRTPGGISIVAWEFSSAGGLNLADAALSPDQIRAWCATAFPAAGTETDSGVRPPDNST